LLAINHQMSSQTIKDHHILVLDGDQYSSLSIVRSLGRKGLKITVAASDSEAICRYSKFTANFFTYPNPLIDAEGFCKIISERLTNDNYTLIIPVTELTTLPLSKIRGEIEQKTVLAIAENLALECVTNKAKTFNIAEKIGVPVPKSFNITTSKKLDNSLVDIKFPVVIKPSRSITDQTDDIRAKLTVDYAFNLNELNKKAKQYLKTSEIILQEYFEGAGIGIELIADHGKIIHAFQHIRLHELPLTGGGSCLRKSVEINPQLLDYAQKLIKEINWHGVAMVEFKHNPSTNKSCLMEINGRFWGSLPLAFSSGSDFPWFLYQLLINQQHPKQFRSSTGHISRKIQGDLYWYIQTVFRRDSNPLIKWPSNIQLISDFISIFHYKHHFDAFYYQDLKPGFIDLKRTTSWLFHFTYEFIEKYRLRKKHHKIKQNNALKDTIEQAKNILFLCYGNINRSAAAECIFQQQINKINYQVQSAGFHPKDKRPADPNMIKTAKEEGIDMQNCTSQTVNQSMLETADIVFVMEIEHIIKLSNLHPQYINKVYLLSSLDPSTATPLEISDPYGQTDKEYKTCFNQIHTCINYLS